jgi:hypothetical protein
VAAEIGRRNIHILQADTTDPVALKVRLNELIQLIKIETESVISPESSRVCVGEHKWQP